MKKLTSLLLFSLVSTWATPSTAATSSTNDPLIRDVLSEAIPTAFAPIELSTSDFTVEWDEKPDSGLSAALEPGSLEWVRVQDVLVLPRARLKIIARSAQNGIITTGGHSQLMTSLANKGIGSVVPVALIGGTTASDNPIDVEYVENGAKKRRTLHIHFRPRARAVSAPWISVDPSCSKFDVQLAFDHPPSANQWIYVGCQRVVTQSTHGRANSLDLMIFWEGASAIQISDVPATPLAASTWSIRLGARPGKIILTTPQQQSLSLSYQLPHRFHLGALSLGLGPYSFHFDSGSQHASSLTPILTLYGSYVLSDSARVVMFDAAGLNSWLYNDFGLYISTENVRALDRRLGVRFMLGGHAIGFKSNGQYHFIPGIPQGFELTLTDALQRGATLAAGGFLYPSINGKAYNNLWLRWGRSIFGEINYISFVENPNDQRTFSKSVGLTVGFPVLSFF